MSLSQYEGWSVAEIVQRNSHELTAVHILQARDYILAEQERHQAELRDLRSYIDDAARIGHRVLEASRKGRKTVRVSELTEDGR